MLSCDQEINTEDQLKWKNKNVFYYCVWVVCW